MSLNKKVLASAIAGLLVSSNAGAVVLLGQDDARRYASELEKPVDLAADSADNLQALLGYNFSGGEVRYGRIECTDNIEIDPRATPFIYGSVTAGSVNGAGTNVLFFSLTADAVPGATAGAILNLNVDNVLLDNAPVNCSFSIYDQPSQAQAGGTVGRVHTTGPQPYIESASGIHFVSDPGTATASVEAPDGAYTAFLGLDNEIGRITLRKASDVLDADGSEIDLFDILDASETRVVVSGDFSAASEATLNGDPTDVLTAEAAGFAMGYVFFDEPLLFIPTGDDAIPASSYTARLETTANPGFVLGDIADVEVGEIVRDGTQLQAPLAQVPEDWLSRMVLTNTGPVDRAYTIEVISEEGTTIGTGDLTGTVPANGVIVVDLRSVLDTFSEGDPPRATLDVTVAGPNDQIQGMYQIVNPDAGSISNQVMVRPGRN